MSVTQVHEALGSFEFELVGNVPREILDTIQYFGHIAIIPGRMDPKQYGDNTLSVSRYVGVVRRKKIADDGRTNLIQDDIRVGGVGMEFWLGDEDGKGEVIENETLFNSATFTSAINTLRPDSLDAGTIGTVLGSYSGRHQYETPRTAIQYVCQTMSTDAIPVGYKVTNDGKLNAGPESDLYVISPTCIIVKKGISQGEDMFIRSLRATMDQDYDMEDFTTRVVMIAEASEEQLATGSADIGTVAPGVNVYKDLNGNALQLTRLVSESDTIESNADTRAELNLRNYLDPHRALTIAADDYDIHGSFEVGDYVWVYDPDGGLVDLANEVYFRGIRINPMKLRVTETNWPLTEGYTIAFRDVNGNWTDLTDYVHWEEEQPAQITIGDFTRSLTNDGETVAARVGSFVQPDASIPAAPTWTTGSFTTANYLDGNGFSKAAITVVWSTPINQDGSSITDGDHYEINYRIQGQTDWSVLNVAWGTNTLRVADLAVATSYEFRVRGIDRSNNLGTFSSTTTVLASSDSSAPSTPAAPTVAASTIAIQVTHLLGKSSGGNFNLESDLAALEVHMSTSTGFTASSGTYVGSMRANKGMMTGSIPAVETFQVGSTVAIFVKVIAVDTSGNKSAASSQATTTALLVDDAHISNLTVTKVSAGTISANWLLGANIQTAASGQRVVLNQTGLHAYNSGGTELVTIDAATGLFTLKTATSGTRMELDAQGIKTYDSDGELSSYLASDPSAASGDYLSFRDTTGSSVASISDEGNGAFKGVYASDVLTIDGDDVRDLIAEKPAGILAVSSLSNATATYNGTPILFGRIIITDFDATRQYVIGGSMIRFDCGNNAVGRVTIDGYLAWDAPASTASTAFLNCQLVTDEGTARDLSLNFRHPFNNPAPSGTDAHIALYFTSDESSLTGARCETTTGSRLYVEDVGPFITYNTFDLSTGSGGGSGSGAPQQYIKTYESTWSGRYNGSGSRLNSNGDMYQGQYDGTNGNQKSMIGFNYATIVSDLTGATIVKVELTMKNKHWYNNGGGTAVVGTHNSTASSAPTTFTGTANLDTFASWPKSATYTAVLDNTDFGTALKNGTAKGIIIGPGNSTSKTFYGYFAGFADTTNRPKLKITYTK